ncbi:MAG: hypothetical protein M0Z65_10815 [Firmicutes bacterium]|nr:hypothetical protein [Bacillota bacterium]
MLFLDKEIFFDYFQVIFYPNGENPKDDDSEYHLYNLEPTINQWRAMSHKDRTKYYKYERARLEDWGYVDDERLYHLQFCKLSDDNPPSLAREDEPTRPMNLEEDEFLGNKVSAIYDSSNSVLLFQRNRESVTRAGLEWYLTQFAKGNDIVKLRPILLPNIDEKIEDMRLIKKIDIKFADLNKMQVHEEPTELEKHLISFKELEAINGQLVLSVGKMKKSTLAINRGKRLLRDIFKSKKYITSAKVKFEDGLSRLDLVDLIEQRLIDSEIYTYNPREGIDHNDMVEIMIRKYKERKEAIDIFLPKRIEDD